MTLIKPTFCIGKKLSSDSPYRHGQCDHCKRHSALPPDRVEKMMAPEFINEKCPMRMQK